MVYNNRSLQFTPAQQAILTTLLYSDIFFFPLTKEELWKLLIAKEKISLRLYNQGLQTLKNQIVSKSGYYCLSGREESIVHRIEHIPEVEAKMRLAVSVAQKFSVIPSVLFVGISGGLAVGNVSEKDDIDFVIITRKNTLFTSRLLVLGILEWLGLRRSRSQKDTANTICVNLLFDETALAWFANFKDVYTAREIVQLLPLFERGNIYQQFLYANKWIEDFLPNVSFKKTASLYDTSSLKSKIITNPILETITRLIQLSSIKRHQTKEIVTKNVLAFHPNDYRIKTLKQLRLKMRQFGLLTNF